MNTIDHERNDSGKSEPTKSLTATKETVIL